MNHIDPLFPSAVFEKQTNKPRNSHLYYVKVVYGFLYLAPYLATTLCSASSRAKKTIALALIMCARTSAASAEL